MEVHMHIVLVHVRVKPEKIADFISATQQNARKSVLEKGIARFDVIQSKQDPARFVLVEVYRSSEATAKHKETEHYRVWKDSVESMLTEPRTRFEYQNIYPDDNSWS
jgi:autoinducer 2-degrading protein